jgi:DNA-binding transcriptional regulator YdaS (Cro superfamily)
MPPIEKLVEFFGGQTQTALALDVSQVAVSYWVSGIHPMGAEKAFKAEELTGGKVTARELCTRQTRITMLTT